MARRPYLCRTGFGARSTTHESTETPQFALVQVAFRPWNISPRASVGLVQTSAYYPLELAQ